MKEADILKYVWENKLIDEAIKNVVERKYWEDFKSHLICELIKKETRFLENLLIKGQLDWFVLRIITNQWRSSTSSFWKEWRNMGFHEARVVECVEVIELYDSGEEESVVREEITEKMIADLLEVQYEDLLQNQYHKVLFNLYYIEGKKLREIEEITGINKDAISRSIRKTKLHLRRNLEL